MNEPQSSRALLLEQLESRCLLAGGVLHFSPGRGDGPQDRYEPGRHPVRDRNDQPAEVQSLPGARSLGNLRSDFDSRHPFVRLGAGPSRPLPPPFQSLSSPLIQAPTSSATIRADAINPPRALSASLTVIAIRLRDSSDPLASRSESLQRQKPPRAEPPAAAKATTSAAEQVLVSTKGSPLPAAREVSIAAFPTSGNRGVAVTDTVVGSAAAVSRGNEAESAGEWVSHSSIPLTGNEPSFRSALAPIASGSASDQRGTIDSFPLLRNTPPSQQRSADEPPWELGSDTLGRLRDIAEQPRAQLRNQSVRPTDAAIARWFQGPGGLVEVETEGAPLIANDAATGIVDIVLDATFGLHRSVDLLASDQTPSTNENIRDVILAVIAGEQSETAAPVQDPADTRLSGLAYAGAVLVATMLAVANRHRKSSALLNTVLRHNLFKSCPNQSPSRWV